MPRIYEVQSAVNATPPPAIVAWLTNDPKQAKAWSREAGIWNDVKSWLSAQSYCKPEPVAARIERKRPVSQVDGKQEVAA